MYVDRFIYLRTPPSICKASAHTGLGYLPRETQDWRQMRRECIHAHISICVYVCICWSIYLWTPLSACRASVGYLPRETLALYTYTRMHTHIYLYICIYTYICRLFEMCTVSPFDFRANARNGWATCRGRRRRSLHWDAIVCAHTYTHTRIHIYVCMYT